VAAGNRIVARASVAISALGTTGVAFMVSVGMGLASWARLIGGTPMSIVSMRTIASVQRSMAVTLLVVLVRRGHDRMRGEDSLLSPQNRQPQHGKHVSDVLGSNVTIPAPVVRRQSVRLVASPQGSSRTLPTPLPLFAGAVVHWLLAAVVRRPTSSPRLLADGSDISRANPLRYSAGERGRLMGSSSADC
jgi:hypothetical protein